MAHDAVELVESLFDRQIQRSKAAGTEEVDFIEWCKRRSPRLEWEWDHLRLIGEYLDRQRRGEIQNLMILCPPQHGKTTTISVHDLVKTLDESPETRIILASYNQERVEEVARSARKLAAECSLLSEDRTSVKHWETYYGGGLLSVGAGVGVTGNPADKIYVDDPIKGREEAESALERERLWNWWTNDLMTRRQKGTQITFVYTPWHMDDLGQRVVRENPGEWTILRLPAIAEKDDPLGREEGEALCPELHDISYLDSMRRTMGDYGFSALYQCRPAPKEGGLFRPNKIRTHSGSVVRQVRAWDLAASTSGDYTVGVLLGIDDDGGVGILDVVRIREEPARRNEIIRDTALLDGLGTVQWVPQDPGAAGKAEILSLVRLLSGFTVKFGPASGSKEVRASPIASQVNAGNVWMAQGEWNAALLAELESFPYGRHDDVVDALASAYRELDLTPTRRFGRFAESLHIFDWKAFEMRFGGAPWQELLRWPKLFRFYPSLRYGTSPEEPTYAVLLAVDSGDNVWILRELKLGELWLDEQASVLKALVEDVDAERFRASPELIGKHSPGRARWNRLKEEGISTIPATTDFVEGWATIDELLRVKSRSEGPKLRIHEDCHEAIRFFKTAPRDSKSPEDVEKNSAVRPVGEAICMALHRTLRGPVIAGPQKPKGPIESSFYALGG